LKTELDILKDVAEKLETINVSYMLTGSFAMMYYAQPRMTRDIDIVLELDKAQAGSFISVFKDEYYISPDAVKDSIENSFMFNIIHNESLIKVDCIIRKPEQYRIVEFNRKIKVQFSGIQFYIVSKEDLILSKLVWAKDSESELQARDIKSLLTTEYDKDYLISWAKKLGLYDFLMSLIK
jgi:hypothetical protein